MKTCPWCLHKITSGEHVSVFTIRSMGRAGRRTRQVITSHAPGTCPSARL